MRKKTVFTVLVILAAFIAKAQVISFKAYASDEQKSESVIYKNFVNECDFMMAYTSESYWWHKRKYYRLLALNKGTWYKGYFFSEELKSGKWRYPKIRFEEIDADSATAVVSYLDKVGFYKINQDSLHINTRKNKDGSVSMRSKDDGVNYKFEIFYNNKFEIIEVYEPEMEFEFLPEITTLEKFIKCRDWFVQKFDALEPIIE